VPAYYPVFLDVNNRRCVVIGGGDLGEEKVAKLLDYGANVCVISPEINDRVHDMVDDNRLSWMPRRYQPGDLDGAFIAIVTDTSDGKINKTVRDEAEERNVPLNVADVTHLCTWITPAVIRRGDVTVAVSTGGASPALARKFREELSGTNRTKSTRNVMDYADLAPLLSDARKEMIHRGVSLKTDHWQACITDDLVDLVQASKTEKAKTTLISRLLVGANCDCQNGMCKMWEDPNSILNTEDEQIPSFTK